jgi:diketogulonate reductase-like aldo/keto reductase
MKQRPFGWTGRQVSVIGEGTWYLEQADRRSAVAAVRRGLDLGMNHIDTAEMYGDGAAEKLDGEAINGRRDEVFLVSKVLPQNGSRLGTKAACAGSLRRLGTDRLDCYLLHWRGSHPLAETVTAFEELMREGKILAWGVSNFDEDDLEELQSIDSETRTACNQVLYHLQERAIEHSVLPWCEKHQVAVTAYSPFGHDNFPRPSSPGGRVLAGIARTHNATPRQIALAFLTRRSSLFAIPKASTQSHAEENADAGAIVLSPVEIARIDAAFPRGPKPPSLPMI